MASPLQAPQRNLAEQVTHMQGIGCGVETDVNPHRVLRKTLFQGCSRSGVVD